MTSVEDFWKYCFYFAMRKTNGRREIAEDFAQEAWIYRYSLGWVSHPKMLWKNFSREDLKQAGSSSIQPWKLQRRMGVLRNPEGENLDYLETFVSASEPEEWGAFLLKNLTDRQRILVFLLEAGWDLENLQASFPEIDVREILRTVQTKLVSGDEIQVELHSSRGIRALERERFRQETQTQKKRVELASVDF